MTQTAIIGGSGLTDPQYLEVSRREVVGTPYGDPSAPLLYGNLNGHEVVFLPRHGAGHSIPPHEINYRANVWALQRAGAANVIAINAVGAIKHGLEVAGLMIPDQIIDYTYGRQHTFFEGEHREVTHVDFSEPYCAALRQTLIAAAKGANVDVNERGTYGATQGPRFESAAEIRRM
ncbi:MAG: S-methyl-5'-thioinosine phosphorylase, partial [Acidiferrobacterales bacterium]